ncbi:MAG: DUF2798 domain-containing protein [Litorivicinus sp.]
MKLPKWTAPYAFGVILSCFMSLIVSAVATINAIGLAPGFFGTWMSSWLSAWLIAAPSVILVAPIVRKLVPRIVES